MEQWSVHNSRWPGRTVELQDWRSFRWTTQSWWLTTKSFDCYVSFAVSRPDTNKTARAQKTRPSLHVYRSCNINCYKKSFFNLTWLREGCAPCDLDLEPRSLTPPWTNLPSPLTSPQAWTLHRWQNRDRATMSARSPGSQRRIRSLSPIMTT